MQWNLLNTTLYLLLTNAALPLGNRHESIEAILLQLGFAIDLNAYNGERIRLKAKYIDSNGDVNFETTVHIDSHPGGKLGQPKVLVNFTTRKNL